MSACDPSLEEVRAQFRQLYKRRKPYGLPDAEVGQSAQFSGTTCVKRVR